MNPPNARIDVQVEALPPGEIGERLDGVEDAEVAARRGADQADRARGDRLLDVLDARHEGLVVDVDLDELDLHQLGPEPEAEVHRHRRDDLGLGLPAVVASQAHRGQVALRPAGRDEAGRIRLAEQRRHHPDGLALHRERAVLGLLGPLDEEPARRHRVDLAADRRRDARVRDREVLLEVEAVAFEPRSDVVEDVVFGPAVLGEVGPRDRRDVRVAGGQVEFGGRHRILLTSRGVQRRGAGDVATA